MRFAGLKRTCIRYKKRRGRRVCAKYTNSPGVSPLGRRRAARRNQKHCATSCKGQKRAGYISCIRSCHRGDDIKVAGYGGYKRRGPARKANGQFKRRGR